MFRLFSSCRLKIAASLSSRLSANVTMHSLCAQLCPSMKPLVLTCIYRSMKNGPTCLVWNPKCASVRHKIRHPILRHIVSHYENIVSDQIAPQNIEAFWITHGKFCGITKPIFSLQQLPLLLHPLNHPYYFQWGLVQQTSASAFACYNSRTAHGTILCCHVNGVKSIYIFLPISPSLRPCKKTDAL